MVTKNSKKTLSETGKQKLHFQLSNKTLSILVYIQMQENLLLFFNNMKKRC